MKAFHALLLCTLLGATALAGCGAKTTTETSVITSTRPPLEADKGAITGLVIDDRYRPVPGALVLATPGGLTATSDPLGQFQILNLAPGAYVLKVQAAGHEAAPKNVDVTVGQYTEVELPARRIFNEQGSIVTTEFSAFIPCAANFIVNGVIFNCVVDLSGDSFRGGFTSKPFNKTFNWTAMVSETLINQKNNYEFQVREDDGSSGGGDRYAVADIVDDVYHKIINLRGQVNTVDNAQRNNVPFNGTKPFATILFLQGDYQPEAQGAFDTVCQPSVPDTCRSATGAGAAFGIKAKFVQSVFIGTPQVDLETYSTLAPA